MEKKMRAYRNYRGVKIFRIKEKVAGSDLREDSNGNLVDCSPKYDVLYKWNGSCFHYDSLDEIEQEIDSLMERAADFGGVPEMVSMLNSED